MSPLKRPGVSTLGIWADTADGVTGLLSALTKVLFPKIVGGEVNGLATKRAGNWSLDEPGM